MTFALSITILLGAAGLGTEVAYWYSAKRDMQNAADLGAASGVRSMLYNYPSYKTSDTLKGYAYNDAKSATTLHGFQDATNSTTVTAVIPPTSGAYAGNTNAIQVTISRPVTALFSGLFLSTGPTIATRAVAKITTSTGDCMLALNPSTSAAFNIQGNVAINVPCGIASASCNNDSFDVTGASASIIAGNLRTCGGINDPHNDVSNSTNETTGDSSISDPYAGQTMPTLATGYPTGTTYPWNKLQSISTASFDANHTFNGNITTSLTSGTSSLFPNGCVSGCVINGNINLSGATLTLGAGVYFVNSAGSTSSGNVSLGANGSLVTSGATVILTSSTASNVGTFNMQSSTSTVTMLAPSSGDSVTSQSNYAGLPGVALYQDRLAMESTLKNNGQCNTNTNSFYGGPSSSFTGAAYLPQGCIQWQGTPVTTNCFQLIGDTLSLNGNPGISVSNCGQGEQLFGPMLSALVE